MDIMDSMDIMDIMDTVDIMGIMDTKDHHTLIHIRSSLASMMSLEKEPLHAFNDSLTER